MSDYMGMLGPAAWQWCYRPPYDFSFVMGRWRMELSEPHSRRPITEKLKCPQCGASAVRLPPLSHSRWWCTACWKGSQTDLARGLDAKQRDALFYQFEGFEGACRLNFASAWQSCDAELQAVPRTRENEKPHAFHRWLNRWLRELIKLQREIINVIRRWPDLYGVPESKREEWIDEVSEVFWIRLGGRQYGAWIIAAAFEPESETAPAWLCFDTLGMLGSGMGLLPATDQKLITEQTLDHLEGDIDRQLRRARHATDRTLIPPDIAAALLDVSRLASLAEARYTEGPPAEQPPVETRRRRLSPIRLDIDPRKRMIAEIRAQHPRGISARDICREMDAIFERVGRGQQQQLQPVESWMRKAPGKRTWTDLFNDSRTKKAVGKYIYQIPALKTSKEAESHYKP